MAGKLNTVYCRNALLKFNQPDSRCPLIWLKLASTVEAWPAGLQLSISYCCKAWWKLYQLIAVVRWLLLPSMVEAMPTGSSCPLVIVTKHGGSYTSWIQLSNGYCYQAWWKLYQLGPAVHWLLLPSMVEAIPTGSSCPLVIVTKHGGNCTNWVQLSIGYCYQAWWKLYQLGSAVHWLLLPSMVEAVPTGSSCPLVIVTKHGGNCTNWVQLSIGYCYQAWWKLYQLGPAVRWLLLPSMVETVPTGSSCPLVIVTKHGGNCTNWVQLSIGYCYQAWWKLYQLDPAVPWLLLPSMVETVPTGSSCPLVIVTKHGGNCTSWVQLSIGYCYQAWWKLYQLGPAVHWLLLPSMVEAVPTGSSCPLVIVTKHGGSCTNWVQLSIGYCYQSWWKLYQLGPAVHWLLLPSMVEAVPTGSSCPLVIVTKHGGSCTNWVQLSIGYCYQAWWKLYQLGPAVRWLLLPSMVETVPAGSSCPLVIVTKHGGNCTNWVQLSIGYCYQAWWKLYQLDPAVHWLLLPSMVETVPTGSSCPLVIVTKHGGSCTNWVQLSFGYCCQTWWKLYQLGSAVRWFCHLGSGAAQKCVLTVATGATLFQLPFLVPFFTCSA